MDFFRVHGPVNVFFRLPSQDRRREYKFLISSPKPGNRTRSRIETHVVVLPLQPGRVGDVLWIADPLVHRVGLVLGHGPRLGVHPLVVLEEVVEGLTDLMDHLQGGGL